MAPRRNAETDYFNVSYGLASAAITTGSVAIATTEAAYHGITIVAGPAHPGVITIYDSAGGASGNIIERFNVGSAESKLVERRIPIMARNGLYLVATGTGLAGSVFYGPKG